MTQPSVSFDRAAAYYDETRGLSDDDARLTTEALVRSFGGSGSRSGSILELGVGTGQVGVPLREAGIDVVGIDLSRPMLAQVLAKGDGVLPFPLVEGDGTRMPFRDDAFDGAYLRWVLHLIPEWRLAVREVARVVAPGGRFSAALGSYDAHRFEIQQHFAEITGVSAEPVGLAWNGWGELDAEIASLGGEKLPDIVLSAHERDDLEAFVQAIEANRFSWTWKVGDDARRRRAAADTRRWAEDRWGPLAGVGHHTFEWRFASYRL